jgi:hypothetical protein
MRVTNFCDVQRNWNLIFCKLAKNAVGFDRGQSLSTGTNTFFFILLVKIIFNLILSGLRIPKWLNCYILKNAISVKITGTTSIARN